MVPARNRKSQLLLGGCILSCILIAGCGPSMKEWEPDKKKPEVFSISRTQLAPQPVYSRTRWVHPPSPLPPRDLPDSEAETIHPVFHLQLQDVTLEEAARVLAATSRYGSYCASTIADKKISVNSLGTTEELANIISKQAGIEVVVDHANRQVRFMAGAELDRAAAIPNFVKEDTPPETW